jgi:hypothetical protein
MRFLDTGDESDGAAVAAWCDESVQSSLVPDDVGAHERQLFLQDFKAVLNSVRHNFDDAAIEHVELRVPLESAREAADSEQPAAAARSLLGRFALLKGR